jgi:hypothetical protein
MMEKPMKSKRIKLAAMEDGDWRRRSISTLAFVHRLAWRNAIYLSVFGKLRV